MTDHKDQIEMQYTAPPVRPLWSVPPYWPVEPVDSWGEAATEPALIYTESVTSLPEELDDVAVCDDSETDGEGNWMANLARMLVFTVLLVALLVVSMVLTQSAGWLADHDVTMEPAVGQQPLSVALAFPEPRGSNVTGSRMSRGVIALPGAIKTGEGGAAKLRETTSRRGYVMTKVASDVSEEQDVSTVAVAHVLHSSERPGTKSGECGDHFFSLCPKSKKEFYFKASQRACLPVEAQKIVAVCNRGANRFRTRESCSETCGGSATDEPVCSEEVLFAECKAEDVIGARWFFDGKRCRAWSFKRGLCPSNGSAALFSTSLQCRSACLKPARCAVPRAEVCALDRLKYPFFADMSAARPEDRCVAATPKNLLGRQCLEGKNRFVSLGDCGRACLERAP